MATIPAHENEFPQLLLTEAAAPATPATGLIVAYAKAGGVFAWKDDAGVEHLVGEGDTAGHIADTTDAHDASAISVDPTGLSVVTGTEVQTAIEELDAASSGAPALAFSHYRRTSGDYTTTSTSYVDIDGTNLLFTISTGARRVRCVLSAGAVTTITGFTVELLIDGVAVGGGDGGVFYATAATSNDPLLIMVMSNVLTAGSHTFKWQWKTNVAGTLTMYAGTAAPASPLRAWVEETMYTT